MGCTVKSLHDVKVTGSKLCGKKSIHVKGWCGLGQVRSSGDFDGLDAPGSRFLKPQVKPDVMFDELRPLDEQKNLKLILEMKKIKT